MYVFMYACNHPPTQKHIPRHKFQLLWCPHHLSSASWLDIWLDVINHNINHRCLPRAEACGPSCSEDHPHHQ